jgi:hypothetical protein
MHEHVLGRWQLHQQNGYNPVWELRHEGGRLCGTLYMTNDEGARAGYYGPITQSFDGELEGDHLEVRIVMPPKREGITPPRSIGVYKGTLCGDKIEGHCHDELAPNYPVFNWHAERC